MLTILKLSYENLKLKLILHRKNVNYTERFQQTES